MNFFQKLRSSNLISIVKQETNEPQHVAIGGLSDELARLNRISGYSAEIERVQREMDLSITFLSKSPEELLLGNAGILPDEYLLYHYGAFLNLVHQMKEKIVHLCDGMTTIGSYKERKGKKQGLIRQILEKEEILKIPDLVTELKKWDDGSEKNLILWALGKRTTHHHHRSRLTLDKDFQDYQLFKTLTQKTQGEMVLTEYGKQVLQDRGINGFKTWHAKLNKEARETRAYIEESIQNISKILYENFHLPAKEADFAVVIDEYQKMLQSFRIVNIAARNKVDQKLEPIIASMEKSFPEILGDNLLSVYLIGSVPRGEVVIGLSDLSLVIVLKNGREDIVKGMEEIIENLDKKLGFFGVSINIRIFLLDDFLSEKNKKTRFYCKTDGILLAGKDSLPEEEYPKPGLQLAALLNSDVLERIDKLRVKFEEEFGAMSQLRLKQIAREVSKITLRVLYTAALSDTAKYEISLSKIKDLIDKKYPENGKLTDALYKLATNEARTDMETMRLIFHLYDEDKTAHSVIDQISSKVHGLEERKKFR